MVGLLVVLVAGVQFGLDRMAEMGASAPTPVASPPPPALDPGAQPLASASPSPTTGPTQLVASLAFDLLPVGPLEVEPPVVRVVGAPQVVAFPSPLDRSLELIGAGDAGLCVGLAGMDRGPILVGFDVYLDSAPTGTLKVTADAGAASPVTLAVAPQQLTGLAPDRWYGLILQWDGESDATIEGGVRDTGQPVFMAQLEPAADTTTFADQSTCLALSSASDDGGLMIDNLRVEQ